MRRTRIIRRTLIAGTTIVVSIAIAIAASNAWVVLGSKGRAYESVSAVPRAQAALVLGAQVDPDGSMSLMLADRVKRGVELWRAGKVDRILLSGDHGTVQYDEVNAMRRAVLAAGVPQRVVFTDHAGFNTWASVVRARKVFGVRSAIVVTQGFHMARALHLAKAAGLPAHGLTADLQPYGRGGQQSRRREILARVKAVVQAESSPGVLLGPRIPISGDGRASWDRPTSRRSSKT